MYPYPYSCDTTKKIFINEEEGNLAGDQKIRWYAHDNKAHRLHDGSAHCFPLLFSRYGYICSETLDI